MKYMVLIYTNEAAMTSAGKADADQMLAAYGAYTEALQKAGVLVAGDRLKPSTSATTIRSPNGKMQVLDGPYAEAKEQLGGYYIIETADLDQALAWAKRCPAAAQGAAELRPIWQYE